MTHYQINTSHPRVLSIQSTVVYGYVGNKTSVYGLQARKIEVDPIMSCQFSNHTGYESWSGLKVDGEMLAKTVQGMAANNLLPQYTHIISGYMAETSFIEQLPAQIKAIKDARKTYCEESSIVREDPRVVYLCDPVIGDNSERYVPEAFVKVYQDDLLPLADIITPNETELGFLTNRSAPFKSLGEIKAACGELHAKGPNLVFVTSMNDYPIGSSATGSQTTSFDICAVEHTNEFYIRKSIGYPTPSHLSSHHETTFVQQTARFNYVTPSCLVSAVETGMVPASPMACLVSYRDEATKELTQYYIRLPRFDGYIVGTGDLTASLVLAHLQQINLAAQKNESIDPELTAQGGDDEEFFATPSSLRDGTQVSCILEAICRALSTIHIVVRATMIRGLVGKHCTTCNHCLRLQTLNEKHPKFAELNTTRPPRDELPQAPIVANLVTEPLELWLPATYHEFMQPTCSFTPQKL